MTVPPFARLPLSFDVAPLIAEVAAFADASWVAHFNAGYHDGGWQGVALRAAGGDAARLYPDPARRNLVCDTEFMARCPRLAAALAQLQCPLRAVRVLRLAPGSVIREHRDDDLRFEDGEARLHVPLATNPEVEFFVDGQRVIMEPGECWYLNLSLPHRVQNRGSQQRIHLVSSLGQARNGETRFVIKLDAWSVFELNLMRRAFPDTPWVYLYRDPLEIAVSQLRERGAYMVPGMLGPAL